MPYKEETESLLLEEATTESNVSKWDVISVKDQSKSLTDVSVRCKSVFDILDTQQQAVENNDNRTVNSSSRNISNSQVCLCTTHINKQSCDVAVEAIDRKCLVGKSGLSKSLPAVTIVSPAVLLSPEKQQQNSHCVEVSVTSGETAVHLQHTRGYVFHNDNHPHQVVYPQRSYETSLSSESVICRICHSSGDDRLIAPCKCSGSSRYVHATCLVTWFKKSVKHQCELCQGDVKIRKINHNISLWRKPEDRPIPIIWFTVFFIGLFLNILSIYVNASESCDSTACLIFYVVNGFGIVLDAAFLWFWFLKCKHYWKKWCALNQDWFIDDMDGETQLQESSVQYVRNQDEAFV